MKYPIAIEPGNDDQAWGVVVPDLPRRILARIDARARCRRKPVRVYSTRGVDKINCQAYDKIYASRYVIVTSMLR